MPNDGYEAVLQRGTTMLAIDLPNDLKAAVEERVLASTDDERQSAFGTKAPHWQAYSDDEHLIIVFGPKAALLEARRFNRDYGTPLPGVRVVASNSDKGSMHIDAHARNLLVTGAGTVITGPNGAVTAEPDSEFALQGIRITGSNPSKYRIRTSYVATFSEKLQLGTLAPFMQLTLTNAFTASAETERD